MACCCRCVLLLFLALAAGIVYLINKIYYVPPVPHLNAQFWGAGAPKLDNEQIVPFKINVPNTVLEDLKRRLEATRLLADPLENVGFKYGMNTVYLNTILQYWSKDYNWKAREAELNKLPQFKTEISGLNIHFIHVKPDLKKLPKGVTVVPLLIIHGWPGSIKEFQKIIPILTMPRQGKSFVFEVIAPSLPGYGFSDAAAKPGLGTSQIALIMKQLMDRLGIEEFYVQGGDWGSIIAHSMAVLYSDNVLGLHANMFTARHTSISMKMGLAFMFPWIYEEGETTERLGQQFKFVLEESGYFHIQATKPDTVGVALTDSPAGLASYILEKFSTWTNSAWRNKPDGGLSNFNKDDLLDNVMIYWVTKSITSSMRLYSETFQKTGQTLLSIPVKVPTGFARFPNEVLFTPEKIIRDGYPNLVRYSDMPSGGHFAAFEVPELLGEDIWNFVDIARTKDKSEKDFKKEKENIKKEL